MSTYDPVTLLFGGMAKLGPGGDVHTLQVLRMLPRRNFTVVLDAGCGTGRQTLVLAKGLGARIDAVDSHQPFLDDLAKRARGAGLDHLVRPHCMDMKDIAAAFPSIDLLWSEGAAYNIGFANALTVWAAAIPHSGFAVVSELCWLKADPPKPVKEFFQSGYPDMQSTQRNMATCEQAGYKVLSTYTLPRNAWVEDYYDILEPRAEALRDHSDAGVREFAMSTIQEIEVFRQSEDSYGYVFYVLQRT